MTSLAFAPYLMFLFLWRIVLASDLQVSLHMCQEREFISRSVGETVTLPCRANHSTARMFFWYKQTPGQKLNLIVKLYKFNHEGEFSDEFNNNEKYLLDTKGGRFHLTISDLQISDSATYFCMGSSAHMVGFGEGATVSVKGSGLDVKTLLYQSESETFQPEDDVSLNCTVHTDNANGSQSIYWYRNTEEPSPGLFYVNEGKNDQQQMNASTQTCVYHQPSENWTHTGTDACAVASCGLVLFGNGPKLKDEVSCPSSLVYILSGALVFTITLSLLLAFLVYKLKKRDHCHCTGLTTTNLDSATNSVEGHQDADHLHYAALRKQTFKRPRKQTNDSITECVYSSVKQ
ncbi:uncharacterized protein LOC115395374 [Salarias fasciatus]|uniref:Uncharacterized LOC115395374 n=1 Tax=Salarias fasciatus TaxID=181472 RepID=A0A672G8X0_SALFA|nr:uncharacterized protein LOC115395374 [Salarias fasciatus]